MKNSFYTLIFLAACCVMCGCDKGGTPASGNGGKSEAPKTTSNATAPEESGAGELVKVSLSVPHMT